MEIIGEVRFGIVRKARVNGNAFAIKFPKSNENLDHEIGLLLVIPRHVNIVGFVGTSSNEPKSLVLEFCSDSSLIDFIKTFEYIESDTPLALFQQIACEMGHLDSNVHRDLAPRNVLVNYKIAKISDFGLARHTDAAIGTFISKGHEILLERIMCPDCTKDLIFFPKKQMSGHLVSSCTKSWTITN